MQSNQTALNLAGYTLGRKTSLAKLTPIIRVPVRMSTCSPLHSHNDLTPYSLEGSVIPQIKGAN